MLPAYSFIDIAKVNAIILLKFVISWESL